VLASIVQPQLRGFIVDRAPLVSKSRRPVKYPRSSTPPPLTAGPTAERKASSVSGEPAVAPFMEDPVGVWETVVLAENPPPTTPAGCH